MTALPESLRTLIGSGPLATLSTVTAEGAPQVSVIWVAMDGDDVVTSHLGRYAKIRNIERDPRVVLSFTATPTPGEFMTPWAALHATARIEETERAYDVLEAMAKVYVAPDAGFPAPRQSGYLVRYDVGKITGVGPWMPGSH